MPKGPEAYRRLKQARGVFGHRLNDVWKMWVGPKVRDVLKRRKVGWTSIDGVRFLTDDDNGKTTLGPVVVWIGVSPGSLKGEDAFEAADDILAILKDFEIHDVEAEFRESNYYRAAGPALLKSVSNFNSTVDVRGPLTTALGLPIAAVNRPDAQGTMAIYFSEGGQSSKTLGLTCHHVVLKVSDTTNEDYTMRSGAPRKDVQLLGTRAFQELLDSIRLRIGRHGVMLGIYEAQVKSLVASLEGADHEDEDGDDEDVAEAKKKLTKVRIQLGEAFEAIEDLEKFYATVKKDWGPASQRTIGHIRRSPPVTFGTDPGGYMEDWAAIELDGPKFKEFKGNFIDLGVCPCVLIPTLALQPVRSFAPKIDACIPGTEMTPDVFTLKMYPRDNGRPSFKYPDTHLLPLCDMISEELMRAPDMLDHDNKTCLLVLKNGNATGVTIGRATGIESFVRDDNTGEESLAWAVYNYDNKSGVFSALGDSGSMVADGLGRMVGMLNGGAGKTESSDVTYVTPMCWLWPRVKTHFPDANLYPAIIV